MDIVHEVSVYEDLMVGGVVASQAALGLLRDR